MKYTAEEMLARFEAWLIREHEYAPEDLIWQEKRNCYADYATHLAWNAYRDAYADLLERIKASEGAVPTFSRSDVSKWRGDAFENAAQIVDRYAEHFPEVTGAADDIRALIAHPPAQAAQSVDIEAIRKVIEVRDWLLARAQDGQMQRSVYTSNYQLREMAEAINVFADKLEAALPEKGNG